MEAKFRYQISLLTRAKKDFEILEVIKQVFHTYAYVYVYDVGDFTKDGTMDNDNCADASRNVFLFHIQAASSMQMLGEGRE